MDYETSYKLHNFARFYDWFYEGHTDDIEFYINLAKEYGSSILELACGTGRLTMPIARNGHKITGIDISGEMLKIAEAKLMEETPEVRNRIRFIEGDMRTFELEGNLKMIFIPLASLFHLHKREDRTACISNMFRHLDDDGISIIDVVHPLKMANQEVGKTLIVKESVNAATGLVTRELNKKLGIDKESHVVTAEHTYIELDTDGGEKRFVFTQRYTWVTEEEIYTMLQQEGFRNIRAFGGYEYQQLNDNSPRMIFLAKK